MNASYLPGSKATWAGDQRDPIKNQSTKSEVSDVSNLVGNAV